MVAEQGAMDIPQALIAMLDGEQGVTRQKAARLVLDLASTAEAVGFVEIDHAHVAGVSVLTGGNGLRQFLADISSDPDGRVTVPTTLNSAGCDADQFAAMGIADEGFLEHQFEIIRAYEQLGISATLSCTPYDTELELDDGCAAWAESNAVCFSNSWTGLHTNRESGLSALGSAITGYAPVWGLLIDANRWPNIVVDVNGTFEDPCDLSLLGDWIGKQVRPGWNLPFGPMPWIRGLLEACGGRLSFDERKALTSAAANHGCPMLWVDGVSEAPEGFDPDSADTRIQGRINFDADELEWLYDDLAPQGTVDLVVIGCPQASLGEVRSAAASVRTRMELGQKIPDQRLWVFTSRHNHAQAEAEGTTELLEEAGALVLIDTCPEVTPYDRRRFNHLLTNSMKAEHYLTSGLNRMPTSVARMEVCIAHAFDPELARGPRPTLEEGESATRPSRKTHRDDIATFTGLSLPSQDSWRINGLALVTDVPITWLGYVNRETGVIEHPGHPLDGQSVEGRILIYPKGSGSTVAPYVLMGLFYTGRGPLAIVNTDVCPLTLPACSLLGIPYAHGFTEDPCLGVNSGDEVDMWLEDGVVTLQTVQRAQQ